MEIQPTLAKSINLFGGVALPTGALAAKSGKDAGYARTGFVLGVENTFEALRHFILGLEVNVSLLPMDAAAMQDAYRSKFGANNVTVVPGSWLIVGVLGNAGFTVDVGSTAHFYGRGKLGIAFGNIPQISSQADNVPIVQNSASAAAFAVGFGVGVIANKTFDIGIHFLSLEPEFKVTTERGGASSISQFSQPTSVFQLRVGYSISLH